MVQIRFVDPLFWNWACLDLYFLQSRADIGKGAGIFSLMEKGISEIGLLQDIYDEKQHPPPPPLPKVTVKDTQKFSEVSILEEYTLLICP